SFATILFAALAVAPSALAQSTESFPTIVPDPSLSVIPSIPLPSFSLSITDPDPSGSDPVSDPVSSEPASDSASLSLPSITSPIGLPTLSPSGSPSGSNSAPPSQSSPGGARSLDVVGQALAATFGAGVLAVILA
ncbi:hypothetical protein R3P38DRAFT_2825510, partial [Favolaschia claudopus]